jgi:hypothetical protein
VLRSEGELGKTVDFRPVLFCVINIRFSGEYPYDLIQSLTHGFKEINKVMSRKNDKYVIKKALFLN